MTEIEMYLNKKHTQIRKVVYCVGPEYPSWRLREFLDHTNLDELILTGFLSAETAEEAMTPLIDRAQVGKQRLPEKFTYSPLNELVEPEGEYALVCQHLEQPSDIFLLPSMKPACFLAEIQESDISAHTIWEVYRKISKEILIITWRIGLPSQTLVWEKDPENNVELSVIFPMYNVEKYLDQCIKSVTAWDADYVEFLFVNDGSPDNSREVILKWVETDSRIKLLDKPNGGCASARQWGLERAKGRYVGFIDPDDFIDESMFRKLFRAAMQGDFDISYCGHKEYYESTGESAKALDLLGWPYSFGVTDVRRIQELIAFRRVSIWRAIYKMSMIRRNNIHFYTEIRRFDDLPFFVETMSAAKSVISVDEYLYYYRLERPGQDVSADDQRLYVHFPIFAHLNDSVASRKDAPLTDMLQICKVGTHRYALEKIRDEFVREYSEKAREDLAVTGTFWRTLILIKRMSGKEHAKYYWAIMTRNYAMLNRLRKKKVLAEERKAKW